MYILCMIFVVKMNILPIALDNFIFSLHETHWLSDNVYIDFLFVLEI